MKLTFTQKIVPVIAGFAIGLMTESVLLGFIALALTAYFLTKDSPKGTSC